jgi:hypothetical protein
VLYVPCIFLLFSLPTTNAQLYITTQSLYIMFNPTYFDISVSSSGSIKNLCLSTLNKFLKLRLLRLQFHKIIRLKYIKILFGRLRVIQKILCDFIISCASSVFLWLHIQFLVAVISLLVLRVLIRGGYRVMYEKCTSEYCIKRKCCDTVYICALVG